MYVSIDICSFVLRIHICCLYVCLCVYTCIYVCLSACMTACLYVHARYLYDCIYVYVYEVYVWMHVGMYRWSEVNVLNSNDILTLLIEGMNGLDGCMNEKNELMNE